MEYLAQSRPQETALLDTLLGSGGQIGCCFPGFPQEGAGAHLYVRRNVQEREVFEPNSDLVILTHLHLNFT